jgi:hypothetical protein
MVLLVLYVAQREENVKHAGETFQPTVWLSRRGIMYALWGDWQTHHSNKMNELVSLGWVEARVMEGVWWYKLTTNAYAVIDGQWQGMEMHRFMQWSPDGSQAILPGFEGIPF